jgi:predicted DNA-binding transcriptional regulator YafY
MAYDKMYNLLELAIWMQSNREGVSIQDMMNRFSVARRTAERMRDVILDEFPQTQVRVGENNVKRWYIPQGTLKDFIQFSAEELVAFEKAIAYLQANNMDENSAVLQKILEKIRANIVDKTYRHIDTDAEILLEAEGFAHRVGPKIIVAKEIVQEIRHAILSFRQIKISYKNKSSRHIRTYQLLPYGILYGDRNHYLVAKHSDGYGGNKERYFILSNILSIELLEETYEIDSNFSLKALAEQSFGVFQEKPFEVEWLFDKCVAEEVKRYEFHPKQSMQENPDGSVTVKFFAGGRLEMDWHLYTWGDRVRVIKPEDWYEKKS